MALYEDGERRLQINRKKDLAEFRVKVGRCLERGALGVTPETQRAIHLR
ncbi:MAG: hypothetical protein HY552_01370 [Elusimicrobia bacterium]|nr:hypothetical protein [Elusimicrobiota bacterium]